MAKILVVYYSRTGLTRTIGQAIAERLGADTEEIIDCADRKGFAGFLRAGKEAFDKIPAQINSPHKDPASYDLVIIGTPVWAFTMSCAVRAYIEVNKSRCKARAFFCTTGGCSGEKTLREMAGLAGASALAELVLTSREVATGTFNGKVDSFVKALSRL
ncbi:MAG TPA: flavodoxin [Candidatus Omnitrophota bacterium]|nr:flavodoxin [Candidatus Omnitrophota bacterium]HPT07280.1 flavodoxin [Candidatus Omnitrophota bacterium]